MRPVHTDMGWPITPDGFTALLVRLRDDYPNLPPIYITENGCAYDDPVIDGRCADPRRIEYLDLHLRALKDAIDDGVDVRGYYQWSLMDNFEWALGYDKRFGLVHVDFDTLERTWRDSASWYRDVIATNTVPVRDGSDRSRTDVDNRPARVDALGMGDTFTAPGPGQWALDRSHYPGGVTPISQWLQREAMPAGMERVFAEIGAPVRRIDTDFVHGYHYTRVRPLIGGDRAVTKLPPIPILKLVSRFHPEFRRRAKRAATTLEDKPYLDVVRRWDDEIRPRLVAQNLAFQQIGLAGLSDEALERHLCDLLDHCREQMELHFWLHGHDIGPLARLIHTCEQWGLEPGDVAEAFGGASPSTARPLELLVRIRRIIEASDAPVESLDDVRECSPKRLGSSTSTSPSADPCSPPGTTSRR